MPISRCAFRFCVSVAVVLATARCGGGGGGSSPASVLTTATPAPIPTNAPPAPTIKGDDWITFAHDFRRSGYQQQPTGITKSTVSSLKLRWSAQIPDVPYTSPLVYNGNVIVTGLTGHVFDLSSASGNIVWSRSIGGEIRMTPTVDGNLVFVGNRMNNASGSPAPSQVYALNVSDGSIAWQATVNGLTHGSPVVANGVVYVPTAGGDIGSCLNGGITALSESTGAQIWRWAVNPSPGGGGSVWGPVSFDGTTLFAGTGNTCVTPFPTANGAVSLQTNGTQLNWSFTSMNNAQVDDDTGSGVLLIGNDAIFTNKNGSTYDVSINNGAQRWSTALGAADQSGGFASPTSDGSFILAGAGWVSVSSTSSKPAVQLQVGNRYPVVRYAKAGYISYLCALDRYGSLVWRRQMNGPINGYTAAITGGIAFANLDAQIVALDEHNGSVLWSYTTPNPFDASPAVVPSGLYDADLGGHVYAFALP